MDAYNGVCDAVMIADAACHEQLGNGLWRSIGGRRFSPAQIGVVSANPIVPRRGEDVDYDRIF